MRSDRQIKEQEIELKLQFLDRFIDIQHLGINVEKDIEKLFVNISAQIDCLNLYSDK
ncbi:hypothetical protein V7139_09510 [Neobacillus drentensis]|uniref:hypothetical protein n=1 Tax=Neobacillus drentensis TaxID=220684 RepID=UPI003001FB11